MTDDHKGTMHFAYDGFKQEGNRRCFLFRIADEPASAGGFSIQIDLALLLKNRVPMQEAPLFCLSLLTVASQGAPDHLDRLRSYTVVSDDFSELQTARLRRAAEKLAKKSPRKPIRNASNKSSLHLGLLSKTPYSRVGTLETGK